MLKYINEYTNTQEEYGYACGRVRELEKSLLTKEIIDKMIETRSLEDSIKILEENSVDNYNINNYDYISIDTHLKGIIKKTINLIKEISPNPHLYKLFSWKYDFHNLKVLLKGKFIGKKEITTLYEYGNFKVDILESAIFDEKYQLLPSIVERIIKQSEDEYMKSSDLQLIEILLDHGYYEIIFNLLNEINHPFLYYFFKKEIDLLNFIISCRSKIRNIKKSKLPLILIKQGNLSIQKYISIYENSIHSWPSYFQKTDYGQIIENGVKEWQEKNSMLELEKLVDNYLINLLKIGKYTSFGIESIFAYYFAKENDIKNIRIILNGKRNLLKNNIIRENIRDCYV